MGLFHFINLESIEQVSDGIEKLSTLFKYWENPSFRVERVVLKDIDAIKWFISKLNALSLNPSKILTSIDSSFDLHKILNENGPLTPEEKIDLEILVPDSASGYESLEIFIQDQYPTIQHFVSPHISLLKQEFQIKYDPNSMSQDRPRTSRPPASFQRKLRNLLPKNYPACIGTEYYNRDVFQTYLKLYQNQIIQLKAKDRPATEKVTHEEGFSQIQEMSKKEQDLQLFQNDVDSLPRLPYPPRQMKYFDLFRTSTNYEFRFKTYNSISILSQLQTLFTDLTNRYPDSLQLLRIGFINEGWQHKYFHQAGNKDKFLLTWNDIELSLRQKNWLFIQKFRAHQQDECSIYFQLTPPIKEDDFRLEIMEQEYKEPIFMR